MIPKVGLVTSHAVVYCHQHFVSAAAPQYSVKDDYIFALKKSVISNNVM